MKKKYLTSQSCLFAKNVFFRIKLLHAHTQCVYIAQAKNQNISAKAAVQVDFSMYALSKHKQNKYTGKKAKFTKLSFCQKLIFWHPSSSRKCSMCLHCVCKLSEGVSKTVVQVDFPVHALSEV